MLGGLLASVKTVPLVEASWYMARQAVGFGQFVSHANSWSEMWLALFPTVLHEGREVPTYLGLATLMLAAVAVVTTRRQWRVGFWLAAGLATRLLGVGDGTPLARVAFELPLYDNFRVAARHLMLTAVASAALAGSGVAALQAGGVSRRRLAAGASAVLILLGVGAVVLLVAPEARAFEPVSPGGWRPATLAVVTQAVAGLASLVALLVLGTSRACPAAVALICVVLGTDLLLAHPYAVTPLGIRPITLARSAFEPSVHTRELREELAPRAPAGTQVDALAPGALAPLWQVPIAGGYGPMLLARHTALASMGNNRSVAPEVLVGSDTALDVLAVRYLAVRAQDLALGPVVEADGHLWSVPGLDLPVGRADCGQRYPRSLSSPSPAAGPVQAGALVLRMRCAEDVPQGAPVGVVRAVAAGGAVVERLLRAGVEIAGDRLEDPEVLARAAHAATPRLAVPGGATGHLVEMVLPEPAVLERIEIDGAATGGWLVLEHLTVADQAG